MALTEAEFKEVRDRMAANRKGSGANRESRPRSLPLSSRTKRGMNKWESGYAQVLEARRAAKLIAWWAFEPFKLRLAGATYYTPDFAVLTQSEPFREAGSELEFHEVKGFWRDDARVKIKVAAEHFPFRFLVVTKRKVRDGGGWLFEEIEGCL
jgi:hypothetical protein